MLASLWAHTSATGDKPQIKTATHAPAGAQRPGLLGVEAQSAVDVGNFGAAVDAFYAEMRRQQEIAAYLAAVQAQREAEAAWIAAHQPPPTPHSPADNPSPSVEGCPAQGGAPAVFIYTKESGCDPNRWSSNGCYGLGQACPGSKLPCGADFVCQDAWFTAYAQRYGGWEGAYAFWLSHHWW